MALNLPQVVRDRDRNRQQAHLMEWVVEYVGCPIAYIHRTDLDNAIHIDLANGAASASICVWDYDNFADPEVLAEALAVAGRKAWFAYEPPPDPPNIIRGEA